MLPSVCLVNNYRSEGGQHKLLEELDEEMSDWAKDLLGMYWDKIDLSDPDLTNEQIHELNAKKVAAQEQREAL